VEVRRKLIMSLRATLLFFVAKQPPNNWEVASVALLPRNDIKGIYYAHI
jgi:hypothetical protein